MIVNLFQSIGITFSVILVVVLAVVTMYTTYILGIGILIIGIVFVTYQLLKMFKSGSKLR